MSTVIEKRNYLKNSTHNKQKQISTKNKQFNRRSTKI